MLIADDHELVAEAMRCVLEREADIEVVGWAATGREALQLVQSERPDVVLMDHRMPELNGIEATSLISGRFPATSVVMVSTVSDPYHVVRALRAGAAGYVPKTAGVRHMVRAVREVIARRSYVHPALADDVLRLLARSGGAEDAPSLLSSRERQVLQLVAEGCRTAEIAERLSVSPRSVETYRTRMMAKLGVHDIAGLVRFAIRHGVISVD